MFASNENKVKGIMTGGFFITLGYIFKEILIRHGYSYHVAINMIPLIITTFGWVIEGNYLIPNMKVTNKALTITSISALLLVEFVYTLLMFERGEFFERFVSKRAMINIPTIIFWIMFGYGSAGWMGLITSFIWLFSSMVIMPLQRGVDYNKIDIVDGPGIFLLLFSFTFIAFNSSYKKDDENIDEYEGSNQRMNEVTNEISKAKNKLNDIKDNIQKNENIIDSLDKSNDNLEMKIIVHDGEINTLKNTLEQMDKKLEEKIDIRNGYEKDVIDVKTENSELYNRIDELNEDISKKESIIDKYDNDIIVIKSNIDGLGDDIRDIQVETNSKDIQVQELKQKISPYNK